MCLINVGFGVFMWGDKTCMEPVIVATKACWGKMHIAMLFRDGSVEPSVSMVLHCFVDFLPDPLDLAD